MPQTIKTCRTCGKPAVSGKVRCQKCLEKNRLSVKKRRDKKKRQHLCTYCGQREVSRGILLCALCADKEARRKREWRKYNKKKVSELNRRRRLRYKSEGRCPKCGIPLDKSKGGADFGKITCINCLERGRYATIRIPITRRP